MPRFDNINVRGGTRHAKPNYRIDSSEIGFYEATAFSNDSETILFSFKTGQFPIRFLKEPLAFDYYLRYANSNYNPAAAAEGGNLPYLSVVEDDHVYVDPVLKGRSFIERVELRLNGVNVYESPMFAEIYESVNRMISTQRDRDAVYGHSEESYYQYPDKDEKDLLVMATAQSDNTNTTSRTTLFGLAGCPLFSVPKSFALSKCRDFDVQDNIPLILPPNTEVDLRLHRASPRGKFLIKGKMKDSAYFGLVAVVPADQKDEKTLDVCITRATLHYEVLDTHGKSLFASSGFRQFYDTPTPLYKIIPDGLSSTETVFQIPNQVGPVRFTGAHTQ